MKILILLFISAVSLAAVPIDRNPEYVAPSETTTTLRGNVSICTSPRPQGGRGGLSFLQTGKGECPPEPRTAEGFDRPAYETDSPGIPFKNKGLE